jgi:hypothetical protein
VRTLGGVAGGETFKCLPLTCLCRDKKQERFCLVVQDSFRISPHSRDGLRLLGKRVLMHLALIISIKKIYGSTYWIGTTECAALFRSFGLRARIMDFGPKEVESLYLSGHGSSLGAQVLKTNDRGKRKAFQVYGPMDKYIMRSNKDVPLAASRGHEKFRYSSISLGNTLEDGSGDSILNKCTRKDKGHQVLIDWVWNYFSDKSLSKSGYSSVIVSEKP